MPTYSEVYLYTDQPTTCPVCGARTELIMDLGHTALGTQVHVCLDKGCGEEFIVEEDVPPSLAKLD